jgi:hypothetical protein
MSSPRSSAAWSTVPPASRLGEVEGAPEERIWPPPPCEAVTDGVDNKRINSGSLPSRSSLNYASMWTNARPESWLDRLFQAWFVPR